MKQLVKHLFFCGILSFMACQNEKSFNGSTDTPTVTPESNQTTANPNGENPDDSIQSDTGNQSTGSTNPPTPIGPEATEEEIQACVQNDQLNVTLPASIQTCLDRGRDWMWDFIAPGSDPCINITPASFTCDFASLIPAASALSTDQDQIDTSELTAVQSNAHLVSCAENHEGNTIVAQFLKLPVGSVDKDCNVAFSKTKVSTRCYRRYQGDKPPATTDPAEITRRTRACLD